MSLEDLKTIANDWRNGRLKTPLIQSDESALFNAFNDLEINNPVLLSVLEELLLNSMEHGKKPIELFLSRKKRILFFGIWDNGVGIHKTIPNNPKLSDTKDKTSSALIRLALEEFITGTGQIGRGVGLSLLSKFVANSKSCLLIWANQSWVFQEKSDFFESPSTKPIAGTMILLMANNA
jgi:hypothetical protein